MMTKRLILPALVIAAWALYALFSMNPPNGTAHADPRVRDTMRTTGVADTMPERPPPVVAVPKADTAKPRTAEPERTGAAEKSLPAACALGGTTFHEPAPGRDQLTFTAAGTGRLQVSGQINSMSVSGSFRVSGTALTAVPKAGSNILGGMLSLLNECSELKGSLTVKSAATGKPVSLPVDVFDTAKQKAVPGPRPPSR